MQVSDSNRILVAVYGSLKRGFGNHHLIKNNDGKYISEGFTPAEYDMLSFGGFPGAIPGSNKMLVEVYEVSKDCLKRLDQLEGHPNYYQRKPTTIQVSDTEQLIAWMYTLVDANRSRPSTPKVQPSSNGVLIWKNPFNPSLH